MRKKGDIVKSELQFPVDTCENCRHDLTEAIAQDIEMGLDEDEKDTIYGLCPKCGRGYPMIEPDTEVPEKVEKPIVVHFEGLAEKPVKDHTYDEMKEDLKSFGVVANASNGLKKKSRLLRFLQEIEDACNIFKEE